MKTSSIILGLVLVVAVHAAPLTERKKVFGVGLGQTGSASLARALELLGLSTINGDANFVPFLYPDGIPMI